MEDTQRVQILVGAGYVFGVAGALAPRLVAKAFGIRDVSGEFESTVRTLSLRNIALAQIASDIADDERLRKRVFTIAAAMFAADTMSAIVSTARGKVSPRSGVMLGMTTGALAAVAGAGAVS